MKITRAIVTDRYDHVVATYEFIATLPEHVTRHRALRRAARRFELTEQQAEQQFMVDVSYPDVPFPIVVS